MKFIKNLTNVIQNLKYYIALDSDLYKSDFPLIRKAFSDMNVIDQIHRMNRIKAIKSIEIKIIELKYSFASENISQRDAVLLVSNLKSKYWVSKTKNIFYSIEIKLRDAAFLINPDLTNNEFYEIYNSFCEYVIDKGETYLNELITAFKVTNVNNSHQNSYSNNSSNSNKTNSMNPDNNIPSFDSSIDDFVKRVNPGDKMKSYISSFGHFGDLKQHFEIVCLDIQTAIIHIPAADRYNYINTYIKKVKIRYRNFNSFPRGLAKDFLLKQNMSLVDFFNIDSHKLKGKSHELPRALTHSWEDYEHMPVNTEVRDIHQSLISLISDHFKEEFVKFLESLALSYLPKSSSGDLKKELKIKKKQEPQIKKKDPSDTKKFPKVLKHIFVSDEVMNDALKVLAQVNPPILNEDCNCILRGKKGTLDLWIQFLASNKLIHKNYNAKTISILLGAHLSEDFSTSSAWKNTTAKQIDIYQTQIKRKLAEVKVKHNL